MPIKTLAVILLFVCFISPAFAQEKKPVPTDGELFFYGGFNTAEDKAIKEVLFPINAYHPILATSVEKRRREKAFDILEYGTSFGVNDEQRIDKITDELVRKERAAGHFGGDYQEAQIRQRVRRLQAISSGAKPLRSQIAGKPVNYFADAHNAATRKTAAFFADWERRLGHDPTSVMPATARDEGAGADYWVRAQKQIDRERAWREGAMERALFAAREAEERARQRYLRALQLQHEREQRAGRVLGAAIRALMGD